MHPVVIVILGFVIFIGWAIWRLRVAFPKCKRCGEPMHRASPPIPGNIQTTVFLCDNCGKREKRDDDRAATGF